MSGTAAQDRAAWLDHYHGCRACQAEQPCRIGLELIAAMRATMVTEESLPAWMTSVIGWSLFWAAVVVGGFLLVEEARVWDLILRV